MKTTVTPPRPIRRIAFRGAALALPVLALPGCGERPAPDTTAPACAEVESQSVPSETRGGLRSGPHTVIWDGMRFWYCVGGLGDSDLAPVVFVHGGPGQGSQHFAALTGPTLESRVQFVYFDQRGSGRSERSWRGDYTIPTFVQDLERLREALGVDRISLLGHSFGGLIALEYAATYPDRVERAVIVAGLSDIPATGRSACDRIATIDPEAYARTLVDPLPEGVCNSFAAYSGAARRAFDRASMFPDTLVAARLDSVDGLDGLRNTGDISRALFRDSDIFRYRFTGHDRVTAPVLVVAGRHDHQIGFEPQRALAQRLPDGRFVVLERGGHFPHLDEPRRFAEAVLEFLADRQ